MAVSILYKLKRSVPLSRNDNTRRQAAPMKVLRRVRELLRNGEFRNNVIRTESCAISVNEKFKESRLKLVKTKEILHTEAYVFRDWKQKAL